MKSIYGDDNDFAQYHDLQNLSSISVNKFCHIYIYIYLNSSTNATDFLNN